MDIQLPGIDGVEALGRLRADERTRAVPVLALTAQAMEGDRERFLAAGFDGYLSKPVDIADLVDTVRRYGEEARAMSDARRRGSSWSTTCRENVRLLEAVLEAHGYEVVSATDGQAALELAVSAKPGSRAARRDDAATGRLHRLQEAPRAATRPRCCR